MELATGDPPDVPLALEAMAGLASSARSVAQSPIPP